MNSTISNENVVELPHEHLAVYRIIANHSDKYITRKLLLAKLGKSGAYGRRLSDIITDLISKYEIPIGSSSMKHKYGYFLIQTENDRQLALNTLESRKNGYIRRYDKILNMEIQAGK